MRNSFLRLLQTPSVERAQRAAYGRSRSMPVVDGEAQVLGMEEIAFISARDSFYLASVGETGWPYVQHRGGPKGFLQVESDGRQLSFPDYGGNRQLLSTGNVQADGRVALFLMDYPAQERLKIIGRARVEPVSLDESTTTGPKVERRFVVQVMGFDWNCPQHITPRFTADEIAEAIKPMQARLAELEAKVARYESRERGV